MLEARFAAITRTLASVRGRRALAPLVGGLLLGRVVAPELADPERAAAKKRKRHGKTGHRGATGPAGPGGAPGGDGAPGGTGSQGSKGEQGQKGDQGATGADGATGLEGLTGDKGEKGDKGDPGLQTITLVDGNSISPILSAETSTATCPEGATAIGGGWTVTSILGCEIVRNARSQSDPRSWEVTLDCRFSTASGFTAQAVCVS